VRALRAELGLDARPVLLYSGNFEPYQGVPLLLEAAAALPQAQLVLMGGEEHEIEAARARVREGGARCVFAGKRPPGELARFLALSDLLVSPRCRGVNTPFKIYTYLASGRPVVATDIASHTQLLDDSLAFLAAPTAAALAAAVADALARPQEARARAARARALIEREYSVARHAEKVRAAYAAIGGR
jgi:glycosyltransferase involved in cell wall biosynthesis